jgi:hypothetical protein
MSQTTTPLSSPPKKELTLNKLIAGAAAAATAAVLGAFFGAAGTVVGAAIGSVASTVATFLYQRSLDTTQDRVRRVIQTRRQTGAPDPAEAETVVMAPVMAPVVPRRPVRWWLWASVTVAAFVVGLLVVTGIEWAKGSTFTGQSGTSVGRVLQPSDRGSRDTSSDGSATSTSDMPTADATHSPRASRTAAPTSAPSTSSADSGGTGTSGGGQSGVQGGVQGGASAQSGAGVGAQGSAG